MNKDDFAIEHAEELKQIDAITEKGHSRHCACRQVWGDGECECDLYKQGYNPYAWAGKTIKDVEPNFKNEDKK